MTWRGIVGKFVDLAGFREHVAGLKFDGWRPSFVVVHNTSEPDLAKWHEWRGRSGWSPEQWARNLEGYYKGMGWQAGPHCFVAPDGILLFTPLTVPGTHSPAWNSRTWGIETVGEFEREAFEGTSSQASLVGVLAALHGRVGLDPADYHFGVRGLHFHKEDPKTTHKECPGNLMVKEKLVFDVVSAMEADNSGGVHLPIEAHEDPPPSPAGAISFTLHGMVSVFGGPSDDGVSSSEGLAVIGAEDLARPDTVLLPHQPQGTTGLARRLDPTKHYIACRWDYRRTPRGFLRNSVVQVQANGKSVDARPADWGPNASTGRVADLSPAVASELSVKTDDECTIVIPLPDVTQASDKGSPVSETAKDLAWVQRRLNAHGAQPQMFMDGVMGPMTRMAIQNFQRRHGLVPDGLPGPLTIAKLAEEGS